MEFFAKPAHQLDFARSQTDNPIYHQHRRCADEAASIWDGRIVYGRADWDPAEPTESSKVVQAPEFNPAETVNKLINPSLSIQEKIDGGMVVSDDMDSLLCFEHMQDRSLSKNHSDKQDGFDWRPRCEIFQGISMGLAYLHEEHNHHICHADLKPDNILLDKNYTMEKLADFGTSRLFVDEERKPNMENCIEKPGHTDLEQHTAGRNVISKKSASYLILRLLIVLESMIDQLTGTAHKHWRNTQHAREMWVLDSSSKQIKRLNQIVCLETGKSRKATAFDVLTLASGAVIGTMVDVAKMKHLPDSNTATDMDSAVLVLALVTTLAAALSMHQHIFWSSLTEERSEKPRSNGAPATNSSDKSTHSTPMATKLTNNEAENHSDPNSSVAERNRTAEENKRPGGIWFIATGAAHHATGNPDLITNLVELESDALRVHAADGTPMTVRGRGSVVTEEVVLPDVYYVPGLCANLVSVGQLAGMDYCVGFGRGVCVVSDAAGTVIGRAHARADGLYVADFLRVPLGGTP